MNTPTCERITFANLTDYAAGELSHDEAAEVEEHLFSCTDCGARAAELDAIVRLLRPAIGSAQVGGFITDAVLNRLSRDGVRVRTFALSPGAVVPCAVWEGDELMTLRMRADFGNASEFTMSQRVNGAEVIRARGQITPSSQGELLYAIPAAWVRGLPAADVEVVLTAHESGEERAVGRYTLVHEGSHRR
jgi:anti-sigma factor RsiW